MAKTGEVVGRSRAVVPAVILCAALAAWRPLWAAQRAAAPPVQDRPVKFMVAKASLADVLELLSRDYHMSFIADARPRIDKAQIDVNSGEEGALNFIGSIYHYTWKRSPRGVVFLHKKFDDPKERPQADAAEWRQTARDMLVLLPDADTDVGDTVWPPLVRALASSLTPAQFQQLRSGGKLPVLDLAPGQQALAARAIDARAYGVPRGTFSEMAALLDGIDASTIERTLTDKAVVSGRKADHAEIHFVKRARDGRALTSVRLGEVFREERP